MSSNRGDTRETVGFSFECVSIYIYIYIYIQLMIINFQDTSALYLTDLFHGDR